MSGAIDDRLLGEGIVRNLHAKRYCGAESRNLALVASHDSSFTAQALRADKALAVDDGDFGVVALELRSPRDILDGSVAVVSISGELLLVIAGENAMLGTHADVGNRWILRPTARHAGGDPPADELILV